MNDSDEMNNLVTEIINTLKTIYDPEIPVNIFDLGLIYDIDIKEDKSLQIRMTMTSPNCPVAPQIIREVIDKLEKTEEFKFVDVKLVWDPPWDRDRMTEEAKLELGFL
jgi:FeS assembly SUF system protein